MSQVTRKSAAVVASAAVAFAGVATPAVASGRTRPAQWSTARCARALTRWQGKHPHPTKRQIRRETRRLTRHGCSVTA